MRRKRELQQQRGRGRKDRGGERERESTNNVICKFQSDILSPLDYNLFSILRIIILLATTDCKNSDSPLAEPPGSAMASGRAR